MNISTDQFIIFQNEYFKINYTIFFTWMVMFLIFGLLILLNILV